MQAIEILKRWQKSTFANAEKKEFYNMCMLAQDILEGVTDCRFMEVYTFFKDLKIKQPDNESLKVVYMALDDKLWEGAESLSNRSNGWKKIKG